MQRNNNGVMIMLGLCLAVILAAMMGSGDVRADDVDVFRTSVKNSAMLVIDNSGSMSWPAYDSIHDYANFMKWMIDDGWATDDDHCRDGATWWDSNDSDDNYDRLDPDQIYLVSSNVGHDLINYTDSNGDPQQVSAIGDVMWKTSANNDSSANPLDSSSNYRDNWLKNTIIVLRNSNGDPWKLPAATVTDTGVIDDGTPAEIATATTIETVTVTVDGEEKYYVVFPTTTVDIDGTETVDNNYVGGRLPNAQDIPLTEKVTDSRTGTVTDHGFLGALRTSGYYFSGVFERSNPGIRFTNSHSDWEPDRVYIFATGRWLNFIKLVEDFQLVTTPGTAWYNYSFQQNLAWRNICDKSAGSGEPSYTAQSTTITSHDTEYSDYPNTPTGDFERGSITPPGTVSSIKVKFEYIDTDPCGSGTDNDYVDLQDANGNSLLAIKGQEIYAGTAGSDAAVSYDGGQTWTSKTPLDSDGYTEAINTDSIRVVWHNGSTEGCSGYDRGFKITGFKYTDQDPGDPGDFLCMNGDDGYGNKIRSRMDVAKAAMKRVVGETRDSLRWGLTDFNSSPRVRKTLGSSADEVITAIDALRPSGGTPLGKALQDAYDDSNYDYYENSNNSSEAECAAKYIIAMTDGFPTGDDSWSRITTGKDGTPDFDDVNETYVDNPNDYGNHSDDVAYWLYNNATHKHTVHTIGFGLDNPLLGDMADASSGIYLTANNEGQLVEAFHSLSLAMTSSQSFVAPVVSVDQANRTQSGDELYTAFFRPLEGQYWVGNLKKYKLRLLVRTDCGRSQSEFVVVGADDTPATDCFGSFLPTATSIWSQVPDGGDVTKGGVGALLKDSMPGTHPTNVPTSGPYYDFRNVYTYDTGGSAIERFIHSNITGADLGVSDSERDKIINFIYGYTYDAAGGGDPQAKRDWILGDFIHSEPTVIDYLDENNALQSRFIVIGSNDGMLHVFTDQEITLTNAAGTSTTYEAGSEIWAFIPADLLSTLQNFSDPSIHDYFMDGFVGLDRARTFTNKSGGDPDIRESDEYFHKTLVFGERRGGNSYWALEVTKPDPSLWTVKWNIQGGQGFLDPYNELSQTWSRPNFARIRTGAADSDLKDVVIFTGGYDSEEDDYPEPWNDDDEDGVFDSGTETATLDPNGNGSYDYYNPEMNEQGRGIFVANLADGTPVFRAVYAGVDGTTTDPIYGSPIHTFQAMKWSFPSNPMVIPLSDKKLVIYIGDIYAQIWKVVYTYPGTSGSGEWATSRVFSANPGSDQAGAADFLPAPALNNNDQGRKMFYGPDVSYLGTTWTDSPVLYFGTGDRSHPRYVNYDGVTGAGYHDRFYVVADTDSSTPANETKLLNLTCDELEAGGDVNQDGVVDSFDDPLRTEVRDVLFGNTDYPVNGEKARGWYRILGKQGDCTQETYDHVGEKVLSQPTLFFRITYFTTFKPTYDDSCNPSGDGIIYALDYDVGTAAFDFDASTGSGDETLSDTRSVVSDSTIPSGVKVITRGGRAAGLFSAGGSLVGVGVSEGTGPTTTIPGPPGGASKILWETY
jgi:type IV pilus assembly protein PilY1